MQLRPIYPFSRFLKHNMNEMTHHINQKYISSHEHEFEYKVEYIYSNNKQKIIACDTLP